MCTTAPTPPHPPLFDCFVVFFISAAVCLATCALPPPPPIPSPCLTPSPSPPRPHSPRPHPRDRVCKMHTQGKERELCWDPPSLTLSLWKAVPLGSRRSHLPLSPPPLTHRYMCLSPRGFTVALSLVEYLPSHPHPHTHTFPLTFPPPPPCAVTRLSSVLQSLFPLLYPSSVPDRHSSDGTDDP